ncbi:MAG TPA: DUF4097 family beta strand repeat-containing protein, partial [Longimicrobium sp.]|nr:DUF4097 family beta strand repeat-containing protein [Longimicrobium sp.]
QVNQAVNTDPTGTVEVHAVSGQVRVTGWSRNQVQVTGQLGGVGERVEVEDDGGGVVVRVVYPRGTHSSNRDVQLDVRVPVRSDVEVNLVSASAVAEGLEGGVEVHTVSGNVRVANNRSREISAGTRSGTVEVIADADRVEANSVSGSVTVSGTVRDRVEAHSVSGTVRVTAAAGEVEAGSVSGSVEVASMRGRAEVSSVSGDLRVTGRGLSGSFQTVSGEITVSGDLARGQDLELTTHSGTITLQMPAGASASVDFSTFSGDIDSEYPGARITRPSRREARVVIGGGDARVTAQTFSGDMRLIRR